jgi:hypothetical protein
VGRVAGKVTVLVEVELQAVVARDVLEARCVDRVPASRGA